MDGDGHIGVATKHQKRQRLEMYLCSASFPFVDAFRRYVIKNICKTNAKANKHQIYDLHYASGVARQVLDHLYKDANLYMDRKYKIYKDYIDSEPVVKGAKYQRGKWLKKVK